MEKKVKSRILILTQIVVVLFFYIATSVPLSANASAATFFLSPTSGTFAVGETFSVSVYINTGGNFINTIEANLVFSPDKLQVVSPSVGKSFIEIWVGQPQYSNINGSLSFKGAVPSPGINISQGIISTITFRVKAVGSATLKFTDSSKILLNDGRGTDILSNTTGGFYSLVLPPPAGPFVTSQSHPDQGKWYSHTSVFLEWAKELNVDNFSYVLDNEPTTVPDNISEGTKSSVEYSNVSDGVHYFHVKALRSSAWGGVTHYAINIDASPPAEFGIKIEPNARTSNTKPVIYFNTTDAISGLNHYEIKIVPLSLGTEIIDSGIPGQNFFVEATNPYITELGQGKYGVIVRAYDNSGNMREVTKRLVIGPFYESFIGFFEASWIWVILVLLILLGISYAHYHKWMKRHQQIDSQRNIGVLSQEEIAKKIQDLKSLQKKYQKVGVVLAILLFVGFSLTIPVISFASPQEETVPSPIITTYSKSSTNNELFYVGGKHNVSDSEILIFVQNKDTGERYKFTAEVDKRGDWFYAHDSFLSPGSYELWAQAKLGDVESPPSAQENFQVSSVVLRLGVSRISYEMLYFLIALGLLIIVILISTMAFIHKREHRRKHTSLVKEIGEAEESVRRGFALIKRDIEDELHLIHKIKLGRELASEEEQKEKLLLDDLARAEAEIGKEVWDIKLQS